MQTFLTGKASRDKPAFLSVECLDKLPVFILDNALKTPRLIGYYNDIMWLNFELKVKPSQDIIV